MALNTSQEAVIAERRRRVTQARLRGLTQREIVKALADTGVLNPDTGKPWSLGIINSDLVAIRDEWRDESRAAIGDHMAAVLAELREVRRAAWSAKDLPMVLKALEGERKLLGLDAPQRVEQTLDATDSYIKALRDFGQGLDDA